MVIGARTVGFVADQYGSHPVPAADGALRLHARDMALGRVIVREAAVKEALGRWVSELEPVLVYNHQGRFVGLTHAGQPLGGYPHIHVTIKGGTPI